MKISVIIPTYHAHTLEKTVRALMAQQPAEAVLEILVVGQQAMGKVAHSPKIRYIHIAERPTPARNRNIGASQAKGDWLYFIDSDCVPQESWLEQILKAIQDEPSAISGSVAIPRGIGYWGRCDHLIAFGGLLAETARRGEILVAPSLNFGIKRTLFLALDGFDETFLQAAGEDTDFCLRLGAAGHLIQLIPEIVVCHEHKRQNLQSTWQHLYRYGEAVTQRRLLRGQDWRWRVASMAVQIPLLCEFIGLGRIFIRVAKRFGKQPRNELWNLWLYPGILLLEYALTLGMIQSLRRQS